MSKEQELTPMLRMENGSTPGRLIPLDRRETVIGRLPDCHIVLKPKYISKKHATIQRSPQGMMLIDHSSAGTFIDGQRITVPVKLEDGMIFQCCDIAFSYHTKLVTIRDHDDDSTVFAAFDASAISSGSGIRPADQLRAVLNISHELGRTLDLGEIAECTLAKLFDIFPGARRGFILLENEPGGRLQPRAVKARGNQSDGPAISRTILKRVLEGKEAVLTRDASLDFPTSVSVTDQRIRSLMCAPLFDVQRRPIGVIQIDVPDGGKFDYEDLNLLVAIASQVSIAVEHARMHEQTVRQKELEQELIYSRQVLQALLPEPLGELGGYRLWSYYEPARFVGGDYYGYFPLTGPDGASPISASAHRWAVAVGDVAGKGMPAALLMSKLSAEVRVVLQADSSPADAVGQLNRMLCETGVPELFITFLLVVIDTIEHRITVVNAGHPGVIIRRASGRLESPSTKALGLPLGVEPDETFRAVTTTIGPGDLIIMFTDGVVEALDNDGHPLGLDRLKQVIVAAPAVVASAGEAIVRAVRDHAGSRNQSDDLTLLCLGRPAAGA